MSQNYSSSFPITIKTETRVLNCKCFVLATTACELNSLLADAEEKQILVSKIAKHNPENVSG
jgi:hypothetical protein